MRGAPDADLVRRLLHYDPETGQLTWKARTADMFEDGLYSAERKCSAWNRRMAGKEALAASRRGYLVGSIFNIRYAAHRVCWLLHYGEWPAGQLDHIDGCGSNNRISNLRLVSNKENGRNQRLSSNNTSGFNGVTLDRGKFAARIRVDGRSIYLGRFPTIEEAVAARSAADIRFGFHENHGVAR